MESVVPFCPLCQISFTRTDMVAYALSCNHLVCNYCLNKQLETSDYLRCYFDGTYTPRCYARELQGLATALVNEYAEVVQITMHSQAVKLDEALRIRFNIYYDRAKIPCRTRNCPLFAINKCGYDHSNKFYKKTYCSFGSSCPNAASCIFIHPGEALQTCTIDTSSTPRPSQVAAAFPPVSSSNQSTYDPSSFYSTMTCAPHHHNYYSSDLPTLVPWHCQNCGSYNPGEVSSCSQCSFCIRR